MGRCVSHLGLSWLSEKRGDTTPKDVNGYAYKASVATEGPVLLIATQSAVNIDKKMRKSDYC